MPPKKPTLLSEVTLDADQLKAIGCVAVESAYLDAALDTVIQLLCTLDETDFRILTAGAQLKAKADVVSALTKARIKEEFKLEHIQLFADISQQIADRNNIIHGSWHVPKLRGIPDPNDPEALLWVKEGETYLIRHKRGEPGYNKLQPKDIMATARGLSRVLQELHAFLGKSGLYPPPRQRSLPRNPLVIQSRDSTATDKEHHLSQKKAQE